MPIQKNGEDQVGGLVGLNSTFSTGTVALTACYATGDVTGILLVGGLVGRNLNSGSDNGTITLTACYATGTVTGTTDGGLVGENGSTGTLTTSYYDSETTGQSDDDGRGTPQTTAGLQGPTGYTGIYAGWNTGANDPWDFGATSQYPVLKVDFNHDGSTSDDVARQRSSHRSSSNPMGNPLMP